MQPVAPLSMKVKFRQKNLQRRRLMPSMATQSDPPSMYRAPLTPPTSVPPSPMLSPATSLSSSYSTVGSHPSTLQSPRLPVRRRTPKRASEAPLHLHIDGITINMGPSPQSPPVPSQTPRRPQMVSMGTQAGAPQLAQARLGAWERRAYHAWGYIKPCLQVGATVALFFLDRCAFAVNVTDALMRRSQTR